MDETYVWNYQEIGCFICDVKLRKYFTFNVLCNYDMVVRTLQLSLVVDFKCEEINVHIYKQCLSAKNCKYIIYGM